MLRPVRISPNSKGAAFMCKLTVTESMHELTKTNEPTMKNPISRALTATHGGAKRIYMGLGVALAVTFLRLDATAQEVDLATANNFAVLAATTITDSSAGPGVINGGNVGLSANTLTSITGFPPETIATPYIMEGENGATIQANTDLTSAFNQAAGLSRTANLTGDTLGSLGTVGLPGSTALNPLSPGVYFFSSSAAIAGTLYLNDEGLTDPVFVFQIGSTLTTVGSTLTASSGSSFVEEDPNAAGTIAGTSVFWEVGSSATLGTGTSFDGNILASASITDTSGSTVDGRLLAETGAVSLNDTTVDAPPAEEIAGVGGETVPDNGSTLRLLGGGLAALFAVGRRFSSQS
jgi:hypothetical protein